MTEKNFRHGTGAHHLLQPESRFPRKAMMGAGVVGGIVAMSFAVTAALGAVGYSDSARLDTEYASLFEVAALNADSEVVTLGSDPLTLRFPHANGFVPGTTAQFSVDIVNNSPSLGAAVQLEVAGAASAPLLHDSIRVSMSAQRGEETVAILGTPETPAESTVTLDEASAKLHAPLEQRDTEPLAIGDSWEGPEASRSVITIYVHLLDDGTLTELSEGSLSTTLTVTGRSFL